ncbi:Gamma-tubulin complex component protein [Trinorchestia longiramus]|nr:Gamma-tubulin complex component protein [Trinorchestia longiramus]
MEVAEDTYAFHLDALKCKRRATSSSESVPSLLVQLAAHYLAAQEGYRGKFCSDSKIDTKLKYKILGIILSHRKEREHQIPVLDRAVWLGCQVAGSGDLAKARAIDLCLKDLESAGLVGNDGTVDAVLSLLLALAKPSPELPKACSTSLYDRIMSSEASQNTAYSCHPSSSCNYSSYEDIVKLPEYSVHEFAAHNLAKLEDHGNSSLFCPPVVHGGQNIAAQPLSCSRLPAPLVYETFSEHLVLGDPGFNSHRSRQSRSRNPKPASKYNAYKYSNAVGEEDGKSGCITKNKAKAELGWLRLCAGLPGCGMSRWFFSEENRQPAPQNCLGASASVLPRDFSPSSSRLTVPRLPEDEVTPVIVFPSWHYSRTEHELVKSQKGKKRASGSSVHSSDEGYDSSQGSGRHSPECGKCSHSAVVSCVCDGAKVCHSCDPTAVWEQVAQERLTLSPRGNPKSWEGYQLKLLMKKKKNEPQYQKGNNLYDELYERRDLPSVIEARAAVTHNIWYKLQAQWSQMLPPSPLRYKAVRLASTSQRASDDLCDVTLASVPRLSVLQPTLLCQRVLHAVIGLPSDTFPYDETTAQFHVSPGTCYDGVTPEALLPLLLDFARTATYFRRLELLCEAFYGRGCRNVPAGDSISSAFITALREILHNLRGEILQLLGCERVLQLKLILEDYSLRICFLARVCRVDGHMRSSSELGISSTVQNKASTATAVDESIPLSTTCAGLKQLKQGVSRREISSFGKSGDVTTDSSRFNRRQYWPESYEPNLKLRDITTKELNLECTQRQFYKSIKAAGQDWRQRLPEGLSLLGALLDELVEPCSKSCSVLLLRLLASAAQPFFKSLERWIYEGVPSPCVVAVNHEALASKDRRFYSEAFSAPQVVTRKGTAASAVPALFTEVLNSALKAGREISFLKICEPQHELVHRLLLAPMLHLCTTASQLRAVQGRCAEYSEAVYHLQEQQQLRLQSCREDKLQLKQQQMSDAAQARHSAEIKRKELEAERARARQLQQQSVLQAMRAAADAAKACRAQEAQVQREREDQLEQQWQQQQHQLQQQHQHLITAVEDFYGQLSSVVDSRDSDHERVKMKESQIHALSKEESNEALDEEDVQLTDDSDSDEESPSDIITVVRLPNQLLKQPSSDDVEDCLTNVAFSDGAIQGPEREGQRLLYGKDEKQTTRAASQSALPDAPVDSHETQTCTSPSMTTSVMSTSSDISVPDQDNKVSELPRDDSIQPIGNQNLISLVEETGAPSDDGNHDLRSSCKKEFLSWKELSRDAALRSAIVHGNRQSALNNKNKFVMSNIFIDIEPEPCSKTRRPVRRDLTSSIFTDEEIVHAKPVIGDEAEAVRKKVLEQEYGIMLTGPETNDVRDTRSATNLNELDAEGNEIIVAQKNLSNISARFNDDCNNGNEAITIEEEHFKTGELKSIESINSSMDSYLENRITMAENEKKMLSSEFPTRKMSSESVSNDEVDDLTNVAFGGDADENKNSVLPQAANHVISGGSELQNQYSVSENCEVSSLRNFDGKDETNQESNSARKIQQDSVANESDAKQHLNIITSSEDEGRNSNEEDCAQSLDNPSLEDAPLHSRSQLPLHSLHFALSLNDKAPLVDILGTAFTGYPSRCPSAVSGINPSSPKDTSNNNPTNASRSDKSVTVDHQITGAEKAAKIDGNISVFNEKPGEDTPLVEEFSLNSKVTSGKEITANEKEGKKHSKVSKCAVLSIFDGYDEEELLQDDSLMNVPVYILRSLSAVVNTQLSVCGRTAVLSLLHSHGLLQDFTALRHWLLLQDAPYAASLTASLLKHHESGSLPVTVLTPVVLNSVLSTALAESAWGQSARADQLSFVLPQGVAPPPCFTHACRMTSYVELQYRVQWPSCVVLTPLMVVGFSRVSSLLLSVSTALHASDAVFSHLKLLGRLQGRVLTQSSQFHSVCLYRHNMAHLITVLHTYLVTQVVSVCGSCDAADDGCDPLVGECSSLDQLSDHLQSTLAALTKRCFLNTKASPVLTLVHELLSLVHLFKAQLSAHNWIMQATDSGGVEYRHRAFAALQRTHSSFHSSSTLLSRLLERVQTMRHVQHVQELLTLLDYTQFYSPQS